MISLIKIKMLKTLNKIIIGIKTTTTRNTQHTPGHLFPAESI